MGGEGNGRAGKRREGKEGEEKGRGGQVSSVQAQFHEKFYIIACNAELLTTQPLYAAGLYALICNPSAT